MTETTFDYVRIPFECIHGSAAFLHLENGIPFFILYYQCPPTIRNDETYPRWSGALDTGLPTTHCSLSKARQQVSDSVGGHRAR